MINPNSKRGRAMLLAAQAQERRQPAAAGATGGRKGPAAPREPGALLLIGRRRRRGGGRRQKSPAAGGGARARVTGEARAPGGRRPGAAPAPEPVIVKPVAPEEPVAVEGGDAGRSQLGEQQVRQQSVSIAPDGTCVVAGFASGVSACSSHVHPTTGRRGAALRCRRHERARD